MAFAALTLGELATAIAAELVGDPERTAGLAEAGDGDLTFLANPRYRDHLLTTRATAAVTGERVADAPCALLVVANPDLGFARAVRAMAPPPPALPEGVHPAATVDPAARLGEGVRVGARAVVEAGAALGDGVEIWPGAYVGHDAAAGAGSRLLPGAVLCHGCRLGERVTLHPGAVVGSDGFGYAWDGERHVKIPQVGDVVVEDDVEIGANTTIDRARFGSTVIGAGCKLDNLIQIAHNVRLGPLCAMAAQVGIAGSTHVGAGTLFGGQAGILGHLSIGPQSRISAMAGVTKDLPGGEHYTGYPARPHARMLEEWRHVKALGRLRRTVRELQRRIDHLEAQSADA
jgi:UDP-3-O-[3-hydroxymyristoyl] glucosamine N-acyltransferase